MSRTLVVAALAAALIPVAVPAGTSAASGNTCAKEAQVVKGEVIKLQSVTIDEAGKPDLDQAAQKKLGRSAYYLATANTTLQMQQSRFSVTDETIFTLACWGHNAKEGAKFSRVNIGMGSGKAISRSGRAVGLSSEETLLDNYANKAMTFSLTRTPSGDPSLADVVAGGPGMLRFGTSTMKKTAGAGYVNVTPYVGPRSGTCRQAKGATLTSKSLGADGYLRGTSVFTGLSPSSPK